MMFDEQDLPEPDRESYEAWEREQRALALTDAQVKHMVNRFLGWRLPETRSLL